MLEMLPMLTDHFFTSRTLPALSITYSLPPPSHSTVLSVLQPLLDTEMGTDTGVGFSDLFLKKKKKSTLDRVWHEIA